MSQNTSSAVMQQRSEPNDSLDDFPTQPWATRALLEHVVGPLLYPGGMPAMTAWEPACNRGYMARPLKEYFRAVHCSDVHDYGWEGQDAVADFLWAPKAADIERPDWIITNPPFRLAEEFARHAQRIAREGVAIIVRSAFTEGGGRYVRLSRDMRPSIVAQFVERVPMVKGRCDPKATSATAYCWLVWGRQQQPFTRYEWIPPCRKQLERVDDYAGGTA